MDTVRREATPFRHLLHRNPSATQGEIAGRLGITQQTVSRAFTTSGWREESGVHPLARRLLAMIDLTTRSEPRTDGAR